MNNKIENTERKSSSTTATGYVATKNELKWALNKLQELNSLGKGKSTNARHLGFFLLMQRKSAKERFSEYLKTDIKMSTKETKDIKDFRITKWTYGKHYYVKYKGVDVVINGVQKWNSYEEALRNAEIYAKAT